MCLVCRVSLILFQVYRIEEEEEAFFSWNSSLLLSPQIFSHFSTNGRRINVLQKSLVRSKTLFVLVVWLNELKWKVELKARDRWRVTWVRISEMWNQRTHRKKRFRDGGRLVGLLRITRGGFVSLLISPRDLKLRLLDAPIRFSLFFYYLFLPHFTFRFLLLPDQDKPRLKCTFSPGFGVFCPQICIFLLF